MEMGRKRKNKKLQEPVGFQMPQAILNQLFEFSNGGYLLFSFDEYGTPQLYSYCDTPKDAIALQGHVKQWVTAMDTINNQVAIQQIIKSSQ